MSDIFIAACCSVGQKKDGVNLGPMYIDGIKYNHIIEFEDNTGYQKLYNTVKSNMPNFQFIIGGDHSIAMSSVGAINDYYNKHKKPIYIIWIDAHADINTFETSETQNIHGMPVAFLMKLCEQNFVQYDSNSQLHPYQIIYIGLRSIDPPEKIFLDKYGITYYTMEYINKFGIINVIKNVKEIVKSNDVHISLDIDGIDPKYCPSTGTPVDNGLELKDVISIIESFNNQIVSCDIVEFNPFETNSIDDIKTTVKNITKIVESFKENKKNLN